MCSGHLHDSIACRPRSYRRGPCDRVGRSTTSYRVEALCRNPRQPGIIPIMCWLYFTGYAFTVASAFPVGHMQHARETPCVVFSVRPSLSFSCTCRGTDAIPHDFAEGRVQAFAPCSHCARLQDVEPGFGCGSGRLHMMRNGPSAALLGAGRSIAPSSFLNKCCAPKEFAVESCRDPFSSAAFSSGT